MKHSLVTKRRLADGEQVGALAEPETDAEPDMLALLP